MNHNNYNFIEMKNERLLNFKNKEIQKRVKLSMFLRALDKFFTQLLINFQKE